MEKLTDRLSMSKFMLDVAPIGPLVISIVMEKGSQKEGKIEKKKTTQLGPDFNHTYAMEKIKIKRVVSWRGQKWRERRMNTKFSVFNIELGPL